jgi:hypothetical protein
MGEAKRRGKRWVLMDDFGIPLNEFCAVWDLTEVEAQEEASSGRLRLCGVPDEAGGYRNVTVRESAAKAWVLREDAPDRVRAKINRAGGLNGLVAWRNTWFERMVWDFKNSTVTLPDGAVYTDVQVRRPDIERLVRSTGPN